MTDPASENIVMPRGLDLESIKLAVNSIKQLRKKLLTREKLLEFDRREIFPEEEIRRMLAPDIGLQLLTIPEEFGGVGGGARDCCAVAEALGGICLGVATAFFAIQLGAEPIGVGGTDAQKHKWLGKIADGKALVAYAVTEPAAGSNITALETTADPVTSDDGEVTGYKINGSKVFISTGGYADFLTVLAKTPEGPTFFIVESGTKGFSSDRSEEKHGIRCSNTSALSFSDVFVPLENLIGGVPGRGIKQANLVFGYTRLMVACMALGAGESALKIAVDYAKKRIQFGTPLSEKQGYTHKLILPHMARLAAARAYIDEVALGLDTTDNDYQVEGSIAKYFTTEAAVSAADDCMQALGGYGYIHEYEVEKISRDVRITSIYEGTSEIQQNIIGMFRWKKTRKSKGGYYNAIADGLGLIAKETQEPVIEILANSARLMNPVIELIQNNKLTKQQHIMFLMADMAAWLEVSNAFVRSAFVFDEPDSENRDNQQKILCARIFAAETVGLIFNNTRKILHGTGLFDDAACKEFEEKHHVLSLLDVEKGIIKEMDALGEIVFK